MDAGPRVRSSQLFAAPASGRRQVVCYLLPAATVVPIGPADVDAMLQLGLLDNEFELLDLTNLSPLFTGSGPLLFGLCGPWLCSCCCHCCCCWLICGALPYSKPAGTPGSMPSVGIMVGTAGGCEANEVSTGGGLEEAAVLVGEGAAAAAAAAAAAVSASVAADMLSV